MTELAERLKRRERELLASRERKSQAYTRARQLQEEEREARVFGELVAREKQAAEDDLREELRVTKERLRQFEEERRQLAEITKAEGMAKQQTDRDQVPRTPPMASPVEARAPRPRETFDELVSILPKDLKTDEVMILRERIDETMCLGFILENSTKQKLTNTDPEDRFKKVIKMLESQMADEYGRETSEGPKAKRDFR